MDKFKNRLIQAAELANETHGMSIRLAPDGLIVKYVWERSAGYIDEVSSHVPWDHVDQAVVNPFPIIMADLTKKASTYQ